MKRMHLVAAMVTTVGVLVVTYPGHEKRPTEAEIVQELPSEVRVLLAGGLCDNIHTVFLMEAKRLVTVPYADRQEVQDRINYYREWLRRKGCG